MARKINESLGLKILANISECHCFTTKLPKLLIKRLWIMLIKSCKGRAQCTFLYLEELLWLNQLFKRFLVLQCKQQRFLRECYTKLIESLGDSSGEEIMKAINLIWLIGNGLYTKIWKWSWLEESF